MSSEGSRSRVDRSTGEHISSTQRPTAKYSALTDSLRVLTTGSMQCSMFCGGKGCKYDNPAKWSEDQMAIKGLFSHWVTKKILAMSRPSTDAVRKYDIIKQFKQYGIKAIINLQTPGEHPNCGLGLEPGGFSYNQQEFMDNDIFFYNFGWDDYGVKSLTFILDMVKVMSFAVKEGKVAVHCHAGLGRTGVLIACYLIYAKRLDGDNAIHFVREKRPGSIQTKGQVECCQQFAQFLLPLRVIFSSCDPCSYPFTLQQFINRQKHMLHGPESRELKHIPKLIKVVCLRLHQLAKIRDVHTTHHLERQDSAEAMKAAVPGAFHDSRHAQDNGISSSSPRRRRSNSTGLVDTENGLSPASAQKESKIPPGRRSPNLDLRKMRLSDGRAAVSSSEDDGSSLGKGSLGSHPSGLGLNRLRTSTSLLSQETLASLPDRREVELVAEAFSYDMKANLADDDDDNEKEDEEDEEDGEMGQSGIEDDAVTAMRNLKQRVESLQRNLNQSESAWKIITTEEDPFVISALMWSWLEQLKEPLLKEEDMETLMEDDMEALMEDDSDILEALTRLDKNQRFTAECILKTIAGLRPLPSHTNARLVQRFIAAATQRQAGTCDVAFGKFVEKYIDAVRGNLPSLEFNDTTSRTRRQSKETERELPRGKTGKEEKKEKGKKKEGKGKKKEAGLSPRTLPPVAKLPEREQERDNTSSDEEQPRQFIVPKKKANVLPPIF
ncbi:protein tyrosine phosphatase domain-containing protein 1-like [Diadema antillarum]|uniref:protein tyrosine phosphatase domain-containing protein 1-like n=1 Tax=Diadema antillarum TaxID=105358 RepID=UPI003A873240